MLSRSKLAKRGSEAFSRRGSDLCDEPIYHLSTATGGPTITMLKRPRRPEGRKGRVARRLLCGWGDTAHSRNKSRQKIFSLKHQFALDQ
jgi:hypothetical protein